MKLTVTKILAVLTAAIALVSCNHKDLCYEHEHRSKIRVLYDWRDAPEANPKGMCVFFYSLDVPDKYYRFDFDNIVGGEIEIDKGRYELITYNNDTELVRFNSTNIFESHEAYTRSGDLLEPLYGNGITSTAQTDNGERVVITPDALWGCHSDEVVVDEHGVTYTFTHFDDTKGTDTPADESDDQTIILYPHDMLCHYSYEVKHVENLEHLSKISASLSGMSGAMRLYDEKLDDEPITLPLYATVDDNIKEITGKFLTFGQNPSSQTRHKMTFYVVMDDGSKYVIKNFPNLDVTSQVDEAPDPRHVHIVIDNLKLPTPGDENDGWEPSVDDWGVEEEEIKV